MHHIHLGDELDSTGVPDWSQLGYNIDGKFATATSTDVCLLAAGASIHAYDPVARAEAERIYQDETKSERLIFCDDAYEAARGADALLIATEWKEFRSPDYDRLKALLIQPLIFDGRNLYDPALMQRLGFEYFAIGRGRVLQVEARIADLTMERL